MRISESVSTRIRDILYERNISIYKLRDITGLNKGTITSLLYNRYDSVNLKTLFIILQSLNITVLEFLDSPLFANLNKFVLDWYKFDRYML